MYTLIKLHLPVQINNLTKPSLPSSNSLTQPTLNSSPKTITPKLHFITQIHSYNQPPLYISDTVSLNHHSPIYTTVSCNTYHSISQIHRITQHSHFLSTRVTQVFSNFFMVYFKGEEQPEGSFFCGTSEDDSKVYG